MYIYIYLHLHIFVYLCRYVYIDVDKKVGVDIARFLDLPGPQKYGIEWPFGHALKALGCCCAYLCGSR